MSTFNIVMHIDDETCVLQHDVPFNDLATQTDYWRAQYPKATQFKYPVYKPNYSQVATRYLSLYGK